MFSGGNSPRQLNAPMRDADDGYYREQMLLAYFPELKEEKWSDWFLRKETFWHIQKTLYETNKKPKFEQYEVSDSTLRLSDQDDAANPSSQNILKVRGYQLTPLQQACIDNNLEEVERLIKEKDAKLNTQEEKTGKTALHFAALLGHHECIKLLLTNAEIRLNIRDTAGITPLLDACRAPGDEGMRCLGHLLYDTRIELDVTQLDDKNALWIAAEHGDSKKINRLQAFEIDSRHHCGWFSWLTLPSDLAKQQQHYCEKQYQAEEDCSESDSLIDHENDKDERSKAFYQEKAQNYNAAYLLLERKEKNILSWSLSLGTGFFTGIVGLGAVGFFAGDSILNAFSAAGGLLASSPYWAIGFLVLVVVVFAGCGMGIWRRKSKKEERRKEAKKAILDKEREESKKREEDKLRQNLLHQQQEEVLLQKSEPEEPAATSEHKEAEEKEEIEKSGETSEEEEISEREAQWRDEKVDFKRLILTHQSALKQYWEEGTYFDEEKQAYLPGFVEKKHDVDIEQRQRDYKAAYNEVRKEYLRLIKSFHTDKAEGSHACATELTELYEKRFKCHFEKRSDGIRISGKFFETTFFGLAQDLMECRKVSHRHYKEGMKAARRCDRTLAEMRECDKKIDEGIAANNEGIARLDKGIAKLDKGIANLQKEQALTRESFAQDRREMEEREAKFARELEAKKAQRKAESDARRQARQEQREKSKQETEEALRIADEALRVKVKT